MVEGGVLYVIDTKNLGSCSLPGSGGSEFEKRLHKFEASGGTIEN